MIMSETTAKKVGRVRRLMGLNQTAFGELFGKDQSTVSRWEKGSDMGPDSYARLLALEHDLDPAISQAIDPAWDTFTQQVPMMGFVGAGAIVAGETDDKSTDVIDYVSCPVHFGNVVAVRVRGDSMWPSYYDGDTIYFRRHEAPISHLIGRDCLIILQDGRKLLKRLERGSASHLFDLAAHNAPTLRDQPVVEAHPVRYIERNGA